MTAEQKLDIIALLAFVTVCATTYITQLDTVRTNRELREAAVDIKRANGYLVRAAAQRKRFWQR